MRNNETNLPIVLVLTNWDSFYVFQIGPRPLLSSEMKEQWYDGYPNEERPISLCQENGNSPVTLKHTNKDEITKGNLYLVWDNDNTINSGTFGQLVKELIASGNEVWVLHHIHGLQPDFTDDKNTNQKVNHVQGSHQSLGDYYPQLFRILADSKNDKLTRVLQDVLKYEEEKTLKKKVESETIIVD